jgi:hypothetical protein
VISALGIGPGGMTDKPEVIIVWSCNETTLPPQGNSLATFHCAVSYLPMQRVLSVPNRRTNGNFRLAPLVSRLVSTQRNPAASRMVGDSEVIARFTPIGTTIEEVK